MQEKGIFWAKKGQSGKMLGVFLFVCFLFFFFDHLLVKAVSEAEEGMGTFIGKRDGVIHTFLFLPQIFLGAPMYLITEV